MPTLMEKVRHPFRHAEPETCAVCKEPSDTWIERAHAQQVYRLCCPECLVKFDKAPSLYVR